LPADLARTVSRYALALGRSYPQYRWVPPDKMHLTLNFLGNVADAKIPSVCAVVDSVSKSHGPFECRLGRLAAFPRPARPRILWLGIEEGKQALTRLHYELAEALQRLDIEPERKRFRPHLTIGRIDDRERWPDALVDELVAVDEADPLRFRGSPEFDAEGLVVYSSFPEAGGTVYSAMSRSEFRPAETSE
jgi:2'-5' RNA ligase